MALRAFFVDAAHSGGQEIAVNIGMKGEAAIHFGGGLKQVVGRHGAQLRERTCSNGLCKFDAKLFGFGDRFEMHAAGRPARKEGARFRRWLFGRGLSRAARPSGR